ncbi:HAMP domain-containing protein [Luteimonas sp. SJ-92]|uniref:HAMP domain-containing protein n=1 Tax=Luteimonas salinisoli TaxID=2752307 RepID=A0A853JHP2_9GAMM|nr:methyl-accepting chemotaxis protein [Luteimonas salinisoli]NZA27950.1 HAMP domain-containing protein [Luteimonas salinisoli]
MTRTIPLALDSLIARSGRPLRRLSIRAKVMLVPVAALAGFLLYAVFSVMVAQSNASTLDRFGKQHLPVLDGLGAVRAEMTATRTLFGQALGDGDDFLVEEAVERSAAVGAILDSLLEADPSLTGRVGPMREQWQRYVALASEVVMGQIEGAIDIASLQQRVEEMNAGYLAIEQDAGTLHAERREEFTAALQSASASASRAAMLGVALVLVLAVCVLFASIVIERAIRGPIEKLRAAIREVTAGRFSVQVEAEGSDAVAMMCRDFSTLLGNLNAAISETNHVLGAVARGDFGQRVGADLPGDLGVLKRGVNASAESVAGTMAALDRVMDAIAAGDFAARMDESVQGESRAKVDRAMGELQAAFGALRLTMEAAAGGDFGQRIELSLPGELDELKRAVNSALGSLDQAFSEIQATTAALADGDLTRRTRGEFGGSLGEVTGALNQALDTLQHALADVAQVAGDVGAGATEIASGNADLSQRTEQQAAALDQSAAAVERLAGAVRNAADNSKQTREITRAANDKAQEGADVVRQAIAAMNAITDASSRIADIIGLIDSIAFQTNLLSLNAAVEAARAGEQGRGFAVVANEVRSLASRTADSAKEVRGLIATAGKRIAEGNQLVARTGQSLEDMAGSSERIAALASEASDSIETQAQGLQQVSQAISQLESSNQQNSAMVEEVAAASASLSDQAGRLREAVSRFRVDDAGAAPTAAAPRGRAAEIEAELDAEFA